MKGIVISGIKGGTGKTSITHALALGAAWHGVSAYVCHTDNRQPMNVKNRPYKYYDARDPKYLESLIESAHNYDGMFIIDGGGNRESFDKWIAPNMDLMIIPITPDPEDIKQTLNYGNSLVGMGLKNIRYLINKYPANKFERKYIQKYMELIPENMIIGKMDEIKSIRVLKEDDLTDFKIPSTKINNFSRKVFRTINSELNN